MPGPRRKIEQYIIEYVNEITDDKSNQPLYEAKFSGMTDDEFDLFMRNLRNGGKLCIQVPNGSKTSIGITFDRLRRVAEKRKVNLYQRIYIPEDKEKGIPAYLTPNEYPVFPQFACRQSQSVEKGRAIPTRTGITDMLTGQAAGDSKKASLSAPEIGIIQSAGLKQSLFELLVPRGGDQGAHSAYMNMIARTGEVSLNAIEQFRTGVVSTETLHRYFLGAHLSTTVKD